MARRFVLSSVLNAVNVQAEPECPSGPGTMREEEVEASDDCSIVVSFIGYGGNRMSVVVSTDSRNESS